MGGGKHADLLELLEPKQSDNTQTCSHAIRIRYRRPEQLLKLLGRLEP